MCTHTHSYCTLTSLWGEALPEAGQAMVWRIVHITFSLEKRLQMHMIISRANPLGMLNGDRGLTSFPLYPLSCPTVLHLFRQTVFPLSVSHFESLPRPKSCCTFFPVSTAIRVRTNCMGHWVPITMFTKYKQHEKPSHPCLLLLCLVSKV